MNIKAIRGILVILTQVLPLHPAMAMTVQPALDLVYKHLEPKVTVLAKQAKTISPEAIQLGVAAYNHARLQGLDPRGVLTIVDYSQPSTQPRLVVLDMKSNTVLFQTLVAHGKNSGDNIPDSFSNDASSHKSSLGLFLTGDTYMGRHGYSLHLEGLEEGVNDAAESREIVMHAADYVSEAFTEAHNRLGRSFGCFAVNPQVAKPIINTIKDGSLIFAYYPDKNWISHSTYLERGQVHT